MADAAAAKANVLLQENSKILSRATSPALSYLSLTEQYPPTPSVFSSRQPSPLNKRPQSELSEDDERPSDNGSNHSPTTPTKNPAKKKRKRAQKTTGKLYI